ncbi:MAG TPA: HD domain-containing phosphohydrolase, partial [Acidimicrobiia bacterium]
SGLDVSPGLVVLLASLVVFRQSNSLAGPLIVAACSGVHVASMRRGRRGWLAFHAASSTLGAAAACIVFWAVPATSVAQLSGALLMLVPAAFAAIAVESVVVALSYRHDDVRPRPWLPELPAIALALAAFGAAGALVGVMANGSSAWMLLVLLVPVLLAPQVLAAPGRLETAESDAVASLMRALEVKDPYTAAHSQRVARYAAYIGAELEISGQRLEDLRLAALLHDIGKLVVPNALLNKPGRLTSEEFDVVKRHEHVSVAMLSRIDALAPVARLVADSRHDTFAELRSLEAHVIAVADAYDAMASTRSYRQALPEEVVFAELRAKAGTQFLAPCVDALIAALVRRGETAVVHDAGLPYGWTVVPPKCGVGSAGLGDLAPEHIDLTAADDVHADERLDALQGASR